MVLGMIAVLITIVIAMLNPLRQIAKSKDALRQHDLQQIKNALDIYYNDHNCYPDSVPFGGQWKEGSTVYMQKVPQDPDFAKSVYVYETDTANLCPQWAVLFANMSAANGSTLLCGLAALQSCVPTNYQPSYACTLLGNVDCNFISSNIVSFPTPTPSTTSTPTPSSVPEQKNLVFVTSTSYSGNLGGLSGADNKCRELAISAGLQGTYKAWLSYTVTSAKSRISHSNYPYVNVIGETIANNWNDLTDGSLDNSINIDETGKRLTANVGAWTGTTSDGSISNVSGINDNCNSWTNATNNNGVYGWANHPLGALSVGPGWTSASHVNCAVSDSFPLHLYCIQQDFSNTPTPTPTPSPTPSGFCSADYDCTGNPARCNVVRTGRGHYCSSNCDGVCL